MLFAMVVKFLDHFYKTQEVQLTASSRRENGGAYGGDVFGGKWVVSKGKIFQITCSVSWYGRFWSTTNFWYSWKRAPLPPSSLAGSRRGTEACRAAAGGHGLTTGFVTSISSYSFSYFIQFCNASLGILVMIDVVGKVMDVIE